MRVAFVLLSLLSLLSLTPTVVDGLGADLLRFRQLTAAAPWPGRRYAFVRQLSGSVSFTPPTATRATAYNNPLVLMGGFTEGWADDYNDVWLSSDGGRNWALAAGVTSEGEGVEGVAAESSFPTVKNNGGTFALLPTGAIVRVSQEVYTTRNVITWQPVVQGIYAYEERNLPTLVATSRGTLIRAGGEGNGEVYHNDVYASTDGGRNWRVATEAANFTARFVNTMLTIPSDIGGGKDITYVIAGRDGNDNYNDVWASSDDGRTWLVISARAPFMSRANANGAVTKDGLLIFAGGYADEEIGRFNTDIANDVWLSMNGGYTWGRCVLDAEWDDRFQQAVTVDVNGNLLVLSGQDSSATLLNDVWASQTSFHDLPAIARVCGLTVPSCGTGLKCWPGADTVIATDGSFVSCSACQEYSVSSSTTNTTALVAALAVFIILFVVAAIAAGYLWNKMQAASKGGPASFAGTSFASADTSSLIGSDHRL